MERKELSKNQKCLGYYFYTPNTDWFFITDSSKRTPTLVNAINDCLLQHGCTYRGMVGCFKLKDMLQRGSIELKTCSHGDYYSISGDGWSCGDFVKNRETKIYQV
jgi:hypothetical protein